MTRRDPFTLRFIKIVKLNSNVTRLGDFWKFWATNLLIKVARKEGWLLGYFEKDLKTAVDIF